MVRLTRIYTKTGDDGRTSLGDGTRVSKSDPHIEAFGTVDELNAILGVVIHQTDLPRGDRPLLLRLQNDLFDVGADLCVPWRKREKRGARLRITAAQVAALEEEIDARNAKLAALTSFVLPGGTAAAAWLHMARVVCRRAEVQVVRLAESHPGTVSAHVLPYLNRLSDLFFVMARAANARGPGDVLWKPGASQNDAKEKASAKPKPKAGAKPKRKPKPKKAKGSRKAPPKRTRAHGAAAPRTASRKRK